GKAHLLGTDHLGRDVLSRAIYGARVSLLVGFAAVVVGGILGVTLGLLAGFRGGWPDSVIMTLADAQLAFPFILLAIGIIAVLGPSCSKRRSRSWASAFSRRHRHGAGWFTRGGNTSTRRGGYRRRRESSSCSRRSS